jgi:hypothetical protein
MKRNLVLILIAIAAPFLSDNSAFSDTYTLTQNTPLVFGGNTETSIISAGGIIGNITDVDVTLTGVRVNDFLQGISEFDVLLVGPQGQKIILISYVCEAFTTPGPLNFTLDGSASNGLPHGQQAPCVSGTFKPSDYRDMAFPFTYILEVPPAPPAPYSTDLSEFNGNFANGTWKIHAAEHEGNEGGTIDSWTLTIETDGVAPPCDYEELFNDNVLTYVELKPSVQENGGNLVLTPAGKKAYTISDSTFTGIQTGTITAEIKFSTNNKQREKGWMVTHWINKKNLMEIQFNIERGKVIVKQKDGRLLAKQKGNFPFTFDTTYTVHITYTGSVYEVSIDNTLVVTLDPVGALPTGILGFQAKGLTESVNRVCVTP